MLKQKCQQASQFLRLPGGEDVIVVDRDGECQPRHLIPSGVAEAHLQRFPSSTTLSDEGIARNQPCGSPKSRNHSISV